MDCRSRFVNSLRGGAVDRFFRYDLGAWPSTIDRWKREGLPPAFPDGRGDDPIRSEGAQRAAFIEFFGHDPLQRIPLETGYTDSPYFPPFEEMLLEETVDYRTLIDRDGIRKRVLKDHPDQSMPQFIEHPVRSRRDWDRIRESHLDPARIEPLMGDVTAVKDDIREAERDSPLYMTACGGFGHQRNLLGQENLYYAFYDEPQMILDIMQNWLAVNSEIIRLVTAHVTPDLYLLWEDMAYKNGPLIGPDIFRRFILPFYGELIRYAKARGIPAVMVDTDGDCRKLIPLFLEAGVDAIMPFEVQSGMDVRAIRQEFGDAFTIVGGIDKRALAKDRAHIRAEIDRVVPFFMASGRYIPCLDHTVPVDVPLENYLFFLEHLRSYERAMVPL